MFKVNMGKSFCWNVCNIERRSDACNVAEFLVDNVMNSVVFSLEMVDVCMIGRILGKESSSIIIAVKRCARRAWKTETIKQFTEEDKFLSSMVKGDVFCIA